MYALSGVGLVVLYRATGVLNIAFGAIGAAGALIAYYLINHTGWPHWLAYTICVAFGGVVNLAYGMVFGPAFARARPAREDDGNARPRADPARADGLAGAGRRRVRALPAAPARRSTATRSSETSVSLTQIISIGLAFAITAGVASSCA